MKSIALLSQKGGAGKTTLAVHLAVLAMEGSKRVCLIDTDPQASATKWWQSREDEGLMLVTRPAAELPDILKAARAEGVDICIADTAPHADVAATSAARAVDFVLIPCQPSRFDLDAIDATVSLVRAVRKKAAIVLNRCMAPRGFGEGGGIADARAALAGHGLPVAPTAVVDRVAYRHALVGGWAVTEYEPDGKAAAEMRSLWGWITENG